MKRGYEVFNVLDKNVLVFESVVHLLLDVAAVLLKLSPRARLKLLDPLILAVNLSGDPLVQLGLPRQALLLLNLKRLLDLCRLLVQRLKDLSLFLHTGIPFRVNALLDGSQVGSDGVQLVLKGLDAVLSLLFHQVL